MIRKWVFAGLMVWVPLGATLFVIRVIYGLLDSSNLLPESWRFPGVGVALTAAVLLGTGALATNLRGGQLLAWAEKQLNRIPFVRSLYGGTKKLAETLLSENSSAFRKVVLVEWPRQGMWSIGFQAGEPLREVREKTREEMVTVFIPTTPNPTSGFIMQVRRSEVVFLDMTVEEGMRYIISLGVVAPGRPVPPSPMLPVGAPAK